MIRRPLLAAALAAAALAPPAAAHGGGGGKLGYDSSVVRLVPVQRTIHVRVVGSDDRLQLRVDGNHTLVIDGYENDPYLRFDPTGVYRNARSPATYLNDARFGNVKLPTQANAKAAPQWVKVAPAGRTYEWHDHRIHWMGTTYPPVVSKDKTVAHHIFNWSVPGTFDAKPLTIRGSLDYRPLPGRSFPIALIIPLVLLVAGGAALVYLRNRRD